MSDRTALPIDAAFDVVFADRMAQLETYNKHHYRPNTYLHKWWGRRCGSTFRLILKGLVADAAQQDYYAPGGLEGKVILDPMMGGGTTLHEAIRLGASVVGVDLDPIPVIQARATLSEVALSDLEAAFDDFFRTLQTQVGSYFMTGCPTCAAVVPLWHTLYGARCACDCGDFLVVDSLVIRRENGGRVWRFCPQCAAVVSDESHACPRREERPLLIEKGQKTCPDCGGRYRENRDEPYHARYEMLAVAGHCDCAGGLFYKSPDWADRESRQRAEDLRPSIALPRDAFAVEPGDKSIQLQRRGVDSYLDLFTGRQLLFLAAAAERLPVYEPVARLNLGLLISTSLEFNSLLCGYKGVNPRRAGAVRHTFSHHAYSFPHTALETNPLYPRRASGTLQKLFYGRIVRGRRWAARPRERLPSESAATFVELAGERDGGFEVREPEALDGGPRRFLLHQGSAVRLPLADQSVDAVVTDPPYFDSIQYSDLAAFFRVWLRLLLPEAADWRYDTADSAVDPERNGQESRYAALMTGIFCECRRVLRPDAGRLIFTFHHWRPKAWSALTAALYEAGFSLLNRYVVHSEHPISVHVSNMNALTHDAILVLAQRGVTPTATWNRPASLRRDDSYRFTRDCGRLMGWLLEQKGLGAGEIEQIWLEAIGAGR